MEGIEDLEVVIRGYFKEHIEMMNDSINNTELIETMAECANVISAAIMNGNKVMVCGNGGSSSDAQHIVAEFVGKFTFDRRPLPALSLSENTSSITAIGNDYGYEYIFSRQVECFGNPGDVLIGISTSGNSANVLKAVNVANNLGIITIGFCNGAQSKLSDAVAYPLHAQSTVTRYVQESHILIGHSLCESAEAIMVDQGFL